ncbi:MAG TPA: DUF1345 domain-containing protein [Parvibaculum sp.]
MFRSPLSHARHHARFYLSALFGLAIGFAAAPLGDDPLRIIIAGDGFFIAYLVSTAVIAYGATPASIRERADFGDEGILLIVCLTVASIMVSIWSIFALLNQHDTPGQIRIALSVASVPLGWLTLHTVSAFHYAHLYYARAGLSGKIREDRGGLDFPKTKEPGVWDFLYYSFVVGMTAQVSDVQVETTELRRMTLAHSIVSFFYNTVLLALAVNVIVSLAH